MPDAEGHIVLTADESNDVLACLIRAYELGQATDNLDLVVMAGRLMDLIIGKWMEEGS